MSLITELKRRNVIRMAGLYLVGAWLLVQVAGTVLPWFSVPASVLRGLVVMLAIGFVPALAFAWVFELTADGFKRDDDVAPEQSIAPQTARRMDRMLLLVSVLALGYFAFDKFALDPRRDAALVAQTTQTIDAEATKVASKIDPHSIAVLPFVSMSEDKDNEFFSDGISEELLNALVRVEGLGVASRTSSFAFKGKEVAASVIAGQLKVRYILEGSVRKQRDAVRITAQLIDASADRHVWSETFDRKLTDIFKIQDEIAKAIVAAVRGSVGPGNAAKAVSVRADTDNMHAYEVYLKARELFIARSDLPESVRLFERAVQMDPAFARGWEGLAAVSSVIQSWGFNDRDYTALARTSAERALKLDPSLSMPWAALAQVQKAKWPVDYEKVQLQMDKAIAADPHNATALLWRSITWTALGFFDRAIADQDLCLKLEPGYHNCRSHKMLALVSRGDETAAIAEFNRGVANGAFASRAENLLPTLVQRGNDTAALLVMDSQEFRPHCGRSCWKLCATRRANIPPPRTWSSNTCPTRITRR